MVLDGETVKKQQSLWPWHKKWTILARAADSDVVYIRIKVPERIGQDDDKVLNIKWRWEDPE